MIRNTIAELVRNAILAAQTAGDLPAFEIPTVEIARPPRAEMGDYSTSLPLKLASVAKRAPLQIAQTIAKHIPAHAALEKVETAAPGFVNFTLAPAWLAAQVAEINAAGARFGNVNIGNGQRVQVEHVSANPTGPLTVGSARNMAIGDTLARVLRAAGYTVATEYYVNDAGSQVRHLGASIYARYAQQLGRDEPFPEEGYRGAYVQDMAREIVARDGDVYLQMPKPDAIRALKRVGVAMVVEWLKQTLTRARAEFDVWFSEQSLRETGLLDEILTLLAARGFTYEMDDALWFQATAFGLDKDAVLVRSPQVVSEPDERATYLASDLAYVWNKLALRGFDRAIYVWGADHHGDVPRVLAGATALGLDPQRVKIILYQLVRLTRGGEKVRMSKRAGEFDTLDDLLDDVGVDAVRFLLITSSSDATMDFDLKLAVKQSNENPVYYVQYMHARIAGILRNAAEQGITRTQADLNLLRHPAELNLIKQMLKLEETVELAAVKLEPHHLPHYALDLGKTFSAFYDHCPILPPKQTDPALTQARLALAVAAKTVLARALDLMGVSAPETM
ncbi:MAG: arginine--tRNA ligase [Chloroflexi bacterium]|nr:arginine--tRNA ligase [Chloroflexota bacterium]